MGRGAPGITKEIGDVAMSLASQLESVHESRRIAQHEIKTDQACQFAEMKRRQDAIAKARPRPAPNGRWAKPKPKNEAQTILHQQPQTTQQHIGHHSIPNIPPPKPKTPAKLCAPDHSSPRHPALQADRAPPRVQVRVSEVREELPQQYEQRVRPPPGLPRRQERRRVSKALPLSSPATLTRRSAPHSMPPLARRFSGHGLTSAAADAVPARGKSALTLTLTLTLTRLQEISEGRAALASLRPKDVVADPELNDALFALRSRIAQIEMRKLRDNGRL